MSKPKKVNFSLIDPTDEIEPYEVLEAARKWHDDLEDANIALAWRKNFKPNADGQLVLGKCIKASDLQKEFSEFDFIILLNREVWADPLFTPEKKLALMDHELCHGTENLDEDSARKMDERGRIVWRVRRHDIEEFESVVRRHGCYKRDLERFAEALPKKRNSPLLTVMESVAAQVNSGLLDRDGITRTAEVTKQ